MNSIVLIRDRYDSRIPVLGSYRYNQIGDKIPEGDHEKSEQSTDYYDRSENEHRCGWDYR